MALAEIGIKHAFKANPPAACQSLCWWVGYCKAQVVTSSVTPTHPTIAIQM